MKSVRDDCESIAPGQYVITRKVEIEGRMRSRKDRARGFRSLDELEERESGMWLMRGRRVRAGLNDRQGPVDELTERGLVAAEFAARILEAFVQRGGKPSDLFLAFAGLVVARDTDFGSECLLALEQAVARGAGLPMR